MSESSQSKKCEDAVSMTIEKITEIFDFLDLDNDSLITALNVE